MSVRTIGSLSNFPNTNRRSSSESSTRTQSHSLSPLASSRISTFTKSPCLYLPITQSPESRRLQALAQNTPAPCLLDRQAAPCPSLHPNSVQRIPAALLLLLHGWHVR